MVPSRKIDSTTKRNVAVLNELLPENHEVVLIGWDCLRFGDGATHVGQHSISVERTASMPFFVKYSKGSFGRFKR